MGKEDGERVFVISERYKTVVIANMGVSVYTEAMLNRNLVDDIKNAIPTEGDQCFIGDGEFVSLNGDFYDFLSERHKLKEDVVGLRLWSILSRPITDTTPYLEMRKWMQDNMRQTDRVSLIPQTLLNSKQEVCEYFEKTSKTYEGVVIKPNLPYNTEWLKMRKSETKDVVIMGIKKTDTWRKHHILATFLVGGYENCVLKRIGDVSSWIDLKNEKEILGRLLSKTVTSEDKDYLYVKPAVVLEIQYHQRMENGLRFPKVKRIRFDKRPEDCPLF